MSIQAAAYYYVKIGGVEITSNNYNNLNSTTIPALKSGTITCDFATRVLTLTNVTLTPGSGKHALELEMDYQIRFYGTNTITTAGASAIRIEDLRFYSVLDVVNGTTTINAGNQGIILDDDDYSQGLDIQGAGSLVIKANNNYPAIENKYKKPDLTFRGQIKADIYGKRGAVKNMNLVFLHAPSYNYEVTFRATNNSSYPVIQGCSFTAWDNNSYPSYTTNGENVVVEAAILKPWGGTYNSTKASIVNSSGASIYNQDILVSTNYKALLTEPFFYDENFRSYLQTLYSKMYITESDVNARTSLNCSGKNITYLEGIQFFTKLKTLNCSNNHLYYLTDYLTNNPDLTTIDCSNNPFNTLTINNMSLTSLTCNNCTRLSSLDCSSNKLSTLNVTGCSSLYTLKCGNNSFTSLAVKNLPYLETLDCSNNTSMTSLDCSYNVLTSLNVSGCSKLTTLTNKGNKFTSLTINGFTKLATLNCSESAKLNNLDCKNNALTSLTLNDCGVLKTLNCSGNKFTQLDVSGVGVLTTLNCSNNTLMTKLDCSYNNISSLTVSGCTKLATLYCNHNQLTSFSPSLSALTSLTCNNNLLTSLSIANCPNLAYLYCGSNKLTTLDVKGSSSSMKKLAKLDIGYNTNLKTVYCQYNPIQQIEAGGCTALETLRCGYNNKNLTTLNLTDCTVLKELDITNSNLASLNLSQFSNLATLICNNGFNGNSNNPIYNFSACTKLKTLKCQNVKLSSLYLPYNTMLEVLDCSQNSLTALDLRSNTSIKEIVCYGNVIKTISLPVNPLYLEKLHCQYNAIGESAMSDIVSKLPNRTGLNTSGSLCVYYSYGSGNYEQNVCTTQNVADALQKNWKTYKTSNHTSFDLYEGVFTIPTAIIAAETDNDNDGPLYNLSGQRVGNDYKGIVIKNGKKIRK
ncbi:MAG: hypothetical protein IJ928_00940 [Prevotella sp.]|nr:hypothetical protein [Prevotella sp.]